MLKHILTLSLLTVFAVAAAPRHLQVSNFQNQKGELTLGGEFPGAKGELSFQKDKLTTFAHIDFDLTKGNYVGAYIPVKLTAGTSAVQLDIRTSKLENASLVFRIQDSTQQEFLQIIPFKATGEVTQFDMDLTKFRSHWSGANDGVIHWPIVRLTAAISTNGPVRKGSFDILNAVAITTASRSDMPSCSLNCTPKRFGALFYPDNIISYKLKLDKFETVATPNYSVKYTVTDWQEQMVIDGDFPISLTGNKSTVEFALTPKQLKSRFGAFKINFIVTNKDNADDTIATSTWFARLPSENPAPVGWIGTGLHAHHGWQNGDLRFMDILAAVGIGVVRDECGWSLIEQEKGKYVIPRNLEVFVDELKRRNIRFNYILDYGNSIYENPCDPVAFTNWCRFMATYFKGRINTFEIWNEPQNFVFRKYYGGNDPQEPLWLTKFVEMTKMVDKAVRSVQPDATIAVTAEDHEPFLRKMLELGIANTHNVISIHPYCHGQPYPEREMFFRDNGKSLRSLALKHGGATQFCITESGWTTYDGEGSYLSVAGGYPRSSYLHQAQFMTRMYILARQLGMKYACQYDFKNDGPNRGYTEHNFGIVHEDFSPKPALSAVACLARLLGTAQPLGDLSFDPALCRLYHFKDKTGDIIAAYAISGTCSFALPPEQDIASLQFIDLMGNTITPPVNNRVLTLTEAPVYIRGCDVKAFAAMPRMAASIENNEPTIGMMTAIALKLQNINLADETSSIFFDFRAPDNRIITVDIPTRRIVAMNEPGTQLVFDFVFDWQTWHDYANTPITCDITLKQGDFTNTQKLRFTPQHPLTLHGGTVIRKNGILLVPVTITSHLHEAIPFQLSVSSPCLNTPSLLSLTLEPGQTQTIPVNLDKFVQTADERVITLDFNGKFGLRPQTLKLTSAILPKLANFDFQGNADNWSSAIPLSASPVIHNEPGQLINGPEDLSVSPKTAWCDNGLLISAEVTDDTFFQPYSNHGDIWKGDSMQVAIATENGLNKLELAVAKMPQETRVLLYDQMINTKGTPIKALYTRLSATRALYEILIPWDNLPSIKDSGVLKLSLLVNDNDGNGRKGWVEFHSGIGVSKNTSLFGIYSLEQ